LKAANRKPSQSLALSVASTARHLSQRERQGRIRESPLGHALALSVIAKGGDISPKGGGKELDERTTKIVALWRQTEKMQINNPARPAPLWRERCKPVALFLRAALMGRIPLIPENKMGKMQ